MAILNALEGLEFSKTDAKILCFVSFTQLQQLKTVVQLLRFNMLHKKRHRTTLKHLGGIHSFIHTAQLLLAGQLVYYVIKAISTTRILSFTRSEYARDWSSYGIVTQSDYLTIIRYTK